jgi:hypothetical protein
MADKPVVHIGENSPEFVALRLMELISRVESVPLNEHAERPYATRE